MSSVFTNQRPERPETIASLSGIPAGHRWHLRRVVWESCLWRLCRSPAVRAIPSHPIPSQCQVGRGRIHRQLTWSWSQSFSQCRCVPSFLAAFVPEEKKSSFLTLISKVGNVSIAWNSIKSVRLLIVSLFYSLSWLCTLNRARRMHIIAVYAHIHKSKKNN